MKQGKKLRYALAGLTVFPWKQFLAKYHCHLPKQVAMQITSPQHNPERLIQITKMRSIQWIKKLNKLKCLTNY